MSHKTCIKMLNVVNPHFPDSTPSYNNEEYFTFKYDPNGNEESVMYVKEARQKSRVFDSSNRITNLEDRGGHQQFNYLVKTDKLDNFIFSHGAFTQTNKYEYNQLDQNTLVTAGGYTYYFGYNEKGNVQTFTTGNGAGTTFNYDDRGLVSNLSIGTADGTDILTEEYVYDANGNRKKIDYLNDDTFVSYDYDDQEQLIKETLRNRQVNEYAYDGFGNREKITVTNNGQTSSTSAIYNIANQLKQFGDEIITYDANGNRATDGKYIYEWNDADQLVSVTNSDETIPFVTYQYDESGKRIQKNINGTITNYHYDGDSINVLYETDDNSNIVRSYTYSASGTLLSMKKGTQTFFYHYNAHGDVIALTNQSGQEVANYEYDAWGNVLKAEEEDQVKDNPYRYSGYQYDQETGLYYLIARYYNPEQGVFLSLDSNPGDNDDIHTQNGYSYANNNPVMLVDPDGNAATAGTVFVSGVGLVIVLVTGAVIVVGGVGYAAGSWLGKKAQALLAKQKSKEPPASKEKKGKSGKDNNTKAINKNLLDGNRVKVEKFKNGSNGKFILEKDRGLNSGNGTHGGSYWKLKDKRNPRPYWSLDKSGNILRYRQ